jgi:hypothetical protein
MFTNYLDQKLLQHAFGGPAWTPPATVYVALSSSAPTQQPAGGWNVTEPDGTGGYARVALANNNTNFVPVTAEPLSGFRIAVAPQISFPESTAPWLAGNRLGYFGLFDATTGGNLLAFGPLNPSVQVEGPGYIIQFPENQLIASIT